MNEDHSLTYAQLHERIDGCMYVLNSNKLTNMSIAIDLPESFTLIGWVIANWNVGNTVLILDPRLKDAEKRERLERFSPDMIISALTAPNAFGLPVFQPESSVQIQDYDIESRYRTCSRGAEERPLLALYSSGSSGLPKQVVRSRSSLEEEMKQYGLEPGAPDEESRVLCLVPVSHSFGLLSACLHTLCKGGTVLFPAVSLPKEIVRMIGRYNVTHVYGVRFHYQMIDGELAELAGTNVRPIFLSSGGTLLASLTERYRQFGFTLTEQYGMSEVGYISVDFAGRRRGFAGPIADHHRWRVETDGQLLLELARSPYTGKQSNWTPLGSGGLLYTQDIVELDANHYVSILARANRIVSVGGLKVDLEEVERKLSEHASVNLCCVVGTEHPVYGTFLEAFVEWNENGELPGSELRSWLGLSLADYKIPKAIRTVERIPTSPAGKVLRGELIKERSNERQTTSERAR